MRFFGREKVAVDSKGRTSMPTRLRDVLRRLPEPEASMLILVPWFGQCLRAYPLPEFDRMLEAFESRVSQSDALAAGDDESDLRRLLYGGAMEVQLDTHGRLVLPKHLRDDAGIATEVYWTTGGNYLELWNPDRLVAHERGERQDYLRGQFAQLSRTSVRPTAPLAASLPASSSADEGGARGGEGA
jgi:MraZ protein